MSRIPLFFAFAAAVFGPCCLALGESPYSGFVSLEQYIGRALVEDHRAEQAGITRTLPLSCPPFHLRDQRGAVIDPSKDEKNPQAVGNPVSTKETCGVCHDYDRITRGYHFQMGRDELYDAPPADHGLPPSRGLGFFGKWQLLYQRELAPVEFDHPDNVDMTAYDWVNQCGICHPGGGPAEYDRARRRYDEALGEDPGRALFMDGDYYGAGWLESGVVEADCFICHLDRYDYSTRAQQLKKRNYQWAATTAAGLGYVWGAVSENQQPKVYYRRELFGPDGKVDLDIRRPNDRQCMTCHDMSGVQKRGTTWHGPFVQDVHSQRGMRCIDCHPGDIRHNFAKRDSSGLTVRPDLDRTMLDCQDCHEREEMGASNYEHPGMPKLHFDRLSCMACHITKRPFLATRTVDTLTGKAVELPVEPDPDAYDGYAFGAQWGALDRYAKDNFMDPFPAAQLAVAAGRAFGPLERQRLEADGIAGDGEAIMTMIEALEAAMPDGDRAACVVRGKAYEAYGGELRRLKTTLQPRRPGATIAEWPLTFAVNAKNGKVVPEGYQLGVFWAYRDKDVVRPLFLKDMQAAWDLLHSDEFRFYRYPAKPTDGERPAFPNPAEAGEDELRAAIKATLDAYDRSERERLEVYDDNNDTWPEANTDAEIALVAWALTRTLERLDAPELYYIKGTNAYRVTVEGGADPYAGTLADAPALDAARPFLAVDRYEYRRYVRDYAFLWRWEHAETRLTDMYAATVEPVDLAADPAVAELAQRLSWSVGHGVEPSSQALGAGGCADCHADGAYFFYGKVMTDPFGPDGTPDTAPLYEALGYTPEGLRMGAWREQVLKPLSPWIVLAAALAMLLHFVIFGVHQRTGGYGEPSVTRFRFHERLSHLIAMVSVAFLTLTGFFFLLGRTDPLGDWARPAHTFLGLGGAIGTALIFVIWFARMLAARGDLKWLLHAGGYLGGTRRLPAGKFNAGQKILFWLAVAVMAVLAGTGHQIWMLADAHDPVLPILYTVHDVAALVMTLLLMAHVYLGVVLNPHGLRSLFGGKVSLEWAQEHHVNWRVTAPKTPKTD